MSHDPAFEIRIRRTYDPLTPESYAHPEAPWAGIERGKDGKEIRVSLAISRLQRLVDEYVGGGISSCSVLIGGDRGAGKTSLVLKVAERLRYNTPPEDTDGPHLEYLAFPRPIVARVHGPHVFELKDRRTRARLVLRAIAEAIHRALLAEFADAFRNRAEAAEGDGGDEAREQAAQFILELDECPTPARLREMWTLFNPDGRTPAPVLPCISRSGPSGRRGPTTPKDQAYRELVAIASSTQMVREIRQHQKDEDPFWADESLESRARARKETAEKEEKKKEITLWASFATWMLDGGRLLNPLAGFVAGVLAFVSVIKTVDQLPLAMLAGLLCGFSTTILLNFSSARRTALELLADSSLASIDRMLPEVIRRIERAGLYPVIVVDELDKVDDLETRMDECIAHLKYFAADQAFVCFLVGRGYYESVLQKTLGTPASRHHSDTFFTDRILVSHKVDDLSTYLGELLTVYSGSAITELEFLKDLYLYRAKGHLSDLQAVIAADHGIRCADQSYKLNIESGNPIDVPAYNDQVYYQRAVTAVIKREETKEYLRQYPNRLEALNQVLYAPARIWERHEWSFTPEDLWRDIALHSDEFTDFVDWLCGYLTDPKMLAVMREPLLSADWTQGNPRYFLVRGFVRDPHVIEKFPDRRDVVKFRGNEMRSAMRNMEALWLLMQDLAEGAVGFRELFALEIPPGDSLVPFTFPNGTDWPALSRYTLGMPQSEVELAALHAAIQSNALRLRNVLLAGCLLATGPAQNVMPALQEWLTNNASSDDSLFQSIGDLIAALEKTRRWTPEMNNILESAIWRPLEAKAPHLGNIEGWSEGLRFLLRRLRNASARRVLQPRADML